MKIINKYVLKEHLGPFIFALTALTSLVLLNYIAKRFGSLVGKGLPWKVIGEFFLLSFPFTLAMTIPMAVLVATLYAFSRLAAENEITAFKASGISIVRLMRPAIWASVVVALFMVGFNDQLLPRANHKLSQLQSDILRKKPTFLLREQVTNKVADRLWLKAGHVSAGSNAMREVVIYDFGDPDHPRTVFADSGTLALTPDETDLVLDLYDGSIQEFPSTAPGLAAAPSGPTGQPVFQQTFFHQARRVVRDVGNQLERSADGSDSPKGDREQTVCELQEGYDRAAADYVAARADMEKYAAIAASSGKPVEIPRRRTMYTQNGLGALYCRALDAFGVQTAEAAQPPAGGGEAAPAATSDSSDSTGAYGGAPAAAGPAVQELIAPSAGGAEGLYDAAASRARLSLEAVNSFDVEIHKKFALATACVIFVLLGAPLALRFPRAGVGLVIGASLGVFALYYVSLIAGETVANAGYLPAPLAMWAANIVFLAAALVLLARAGHESGSARGNDFGEWLARVRDRFGGRRRVPAAEPRSAS